jgi:N-acyl-D-aspartate/D-glutamate deacylase
MAKAIEEGLNERKMEKEKEAGDKKKKTVEMKEKQEAGPRKLRAKKSKPEASEKYSPNPVINEVKAETKKDDKTNATDSESKKELAETDSKNDK